MRIVIKQCRYCYRESDLCSYRKYIKDISNNTPHGITVTHKCTEYAKTIPCGSRVEIELKEIEESVLRYYDNNEQPGEDIEYNWVSRGMATGEIISECRGFFIVKLDNPVMLNLPLRGGYWQQAEKVEVVRIRKRGKDIKILSSPEVVV